VSAAEHAIGVVKVEGDFDRHGGKDEPDQVAPAKEHEHELESERRWLASDAVTRIKMRNSLFAGESSGVSSPVQRPPVVEVDQRANLIKTSQSSNGRDDEHDAEPQRATSAHDGVIEADAAVGADLGEEEGVGNQALLRILRLRFVKLTPERDQRVVDAMQPEPHAVHADAQTDSQPQMGTEAAEHAHGAGPVVVVQAGAVAPDAEDTKNSPTAEMHEHQAVDLGELVRAAVVGHGDEQREQKDGTGVGGTSKLGREQCVGDVAAEPREVDTQPDTEAVVVCRAVAHALVCAGIARGEETRAPVHRRGHGRGRGDVACRGVLLLSALQVEALRVTIEEE